jgi:Ca2+/H+ antiporter
MMQMQARLSEGLPDFLPAEVAGMVMGALLLLVGLTFLFWRFG